MKENNLKNILNKVSTPSYIFDFDNFEKRARKIKEIVGKNVDLCYSMKANPFFVQDLPHDFSKIEVCSHGEFLICQKLKIDPTMIFYSGVNKRAEEVEEAIEYGVTNFTAESVKHINILQKMSSKYKKVLNVYLRISSDTQFGMELLEIESIIQKKSQYSFLNIVGLHYFTGTQKKKCEVIIKELLFLQHVLNEIRNNYGYIIKEVEYGTGLYIEYFGKPEQEFKDLYAIKEALEQLAQNTHVTIEMGRFFSATSGWYLTRIDDKKEVDGTKYLIINGGINQLVYDGQLKGMRKPSAFLYKNKKDCNDELKGEDFTICGSLCTPNDIIVRDFELKNPEIDDFIIFENVGDYSFME